MQFNTFGMQFTTFQRSSIVVAVPVAVAMAVGVVVAVAVLVVMAVTVAVAVALLLFVRRSPQFDGPSQEISSI